MIARLHEELTIYEGSDEIRTPFVKRTDKYPNTAAADWRFGAGFAVGPVSSSHELRRPDRETESSWPLGLYCS
jgi:hypothetical protein